MTRAEFERRLVRFAESVILIERSADVPEWHKRQRRFEKDRAAVLAAFDEAKREGSDGK